MTGSADFKQRLTSPCGLMAWGERKENEGMKATGIVRRVEDWGECYPERSPQTAKDYRVYANGIICGR